MSEPIDIFVNMVPSLGGVTTAFQKAGGEAAENFNEAFKAGMERLGEGLPGLSKLTSVMGIAGAAGGKVFASGFADQVAIGLNAIQGARIGPTLDTMTAAMGAAGVHGAKMFSDNFAKNIATGLTAQSIAGMEQNLVAAMRGAGLKASDEFMTAMAGQLQAGLDMAPAAQAVSASVGNLLKGAAAHGGAIFNEELAAKIAIGTKALTLGGAENALAQSFGAIGEAGGQLFSSKLSKTVGTAMAALGSKEVTAEKLTNALAAAGIQAGTAFGENANKYLMAGLKDLGAIDAFQVLIKERVEAALAAAGSNARSAAVESVGARMAQTLVNKGDIENAAAVYAQELERAFGAAGIKVGKKFTEELAAELVAAKGTASAATASADNIAKAFGRTGSVAGKQFSADFVKEVEVRLAALGGEASLANLTRVFSQMGVTNAEEFAKSFAAASASGLGETMKELHTQIMGGVKSAFEKAQPFLESLGGGSAAKGIMRIGAFAAAGELFVKDVKSYVELANKEFEKFGNVAKESAEAAMKSFEGIISGKGPDVESAFKAVSEGISVSLQAPLDALSTAVDNSVGRIPIVGELFKMPLEELQAGLGAATEAFDVAGGAASSYMHTLVEIGDSYIEVGRKMASQTLGNPEEIEHLTGQLRDIMAEGAVVHFDDVAESLGRISTNMGNLDSGQLREFATNFAMAEELVGNVDPTKLVGVLQAFGETGDKANEALTKLVNLSRATGQALNTTTTEMTNAGPAFKELGYDMGQTAQFFTVMAREGDTAGRAVYAFTSAVKTFTEAREKGLTTLDPKEMMAKTIKAIQQFSESGDVQAASELAFKTFGQRGGVYILDAIKRGILDIPELMKPLEGIDEPFKEAVEETKSLGDAWEIVGQQMQASLAPVGEALAKNLVGAGNEVTTWLAENQDKILKWGTEVADAILDAMTVIGGLVGNTIANLSAMLNPLKEIALSAVNAIVLPLKGLTTALSAIPGDPLGMGNINHVLHDTIDNLRTIEHTDLGHVGYEFGRGIQEAAGKLPGLKQRLDAASQSMQGTLEVAEALQEKIDGEMQSGIAQLKDSQGNLMGGATPDNPMMRMLGSPEDWARIKANLSRLGIEIKANTAGVITAVTYANEKAHEQWNKWFEEQIRKPPDPIAVPLKGYGPDGRPLEGAGDLVPKGGSAVEVPVTGSGAGAGTSGGGGGEGTVPFNPTPMTLPSFVNSPGQSSYTGGQTPTLSMPTGGSGTAGLTAALQAKGFTPDQIRLVQAFSQVEGLNPQGVPTLGFTNDQAGTDLQSHVDALARQFVNRASVAGPYPASGSDADKAQWIARLVGQAGLASDWEGNAQPKDYVQRVVNALQGIPAAGAPAGPAAGPSVVPSMPPAVTVPTYTPPAASVPTYTPPAVSVPTPAMPAAPAAGAETGPSAHIPAPKPGWANHAGWSYYRRPDNGQVFWVPPGVTAPDIADGGPSPSSVPEGYVWDSVESTEQGMTVSVLTKRNTPAAQPPSVQAPPNLPGTGSAVGEAVPAPGVVAPKPPEGAYTVPEGKFNPQDPPMLPPGAKAWVQNKDRSWSAVDEAGKPVKPGAAAPAAPPSPAQPKVPTHSALSDYSTDWSAGVNPTRAGAGSDHIGPFPTPPGMGKGSTSIPETQPRPGVGHSVMDYLWFGQRPAAGAPKPASPSPGSFNLGSLGGLDWSPARPGTRMPEPSAPSLGDFALGNLPPTGPRPPGLDRFITTPPPPTSTPVPPELAPLVPGGSDRPWVTPPPAFIQYDTSGDGFAAGGLVGFDQGGNVTGRHSIAGPGDGSDPREGDLGWAPIVRPINPYTGLPLFEDQQHHLTGGFIGFNTGGDAGSGSGGVTAQECIDVAARLKSQGVPDEQICLILEKTYGLQKFVAESIVHAAGARHRQTGGRVGFDSGGVAGPHDPSFGDFALGDVPPAGPDLLPGIERFIAPDRWVGNQEPTGPDRYNTPRPGHWPDYSQSHEPYYPPRPYPVDESSGGNPWWQWIVGNLTFKGFDGGGSVGSHDTPHSPFGDFALGDVPPPGPDLLPGIERFIAPDRWVGNQEPTGPDRYNTPRPGHWPRTGFDHGGPADLPSDGWIRGPWTPGKDTVPHDLPVGSYVIRRTQAQKHAAFLNSLRGAALRGATKGAKAGHIPAILEPGEVVMPPEMEGLRPLFDAINYGRRGFQPGGPVQLDTRGAQVDTIAVAEAVAQAFGITDIGMYRSPDGYNEHSTGEAADVMVGTDNPVGNQVKDYVLQNAAQFGVQYAIWQNKLWYPDGRVENYGANPSDVTLSHRNHVHVRTDGGGYPPGGGPGADGTGGAPRTGGTSNTPSPAASAMLGGGGTIPMPTSGGGVQLTGYGASAGGGGGGLTGSYTTDKRNYEIQQYQDEQTRSQEEVNRARREQAQRTEAYNKALAEATEAQNKYNAEVAEWNRLTPEEQAAKIDLRAKMVEDKKKADEKTAALNSANESLISANESVGSAERSQRLTSMKPPPWEKGEKLSFNKEAEQLGAGFVKGLFQELGFPDVFGKPFTEWGAYKLMMGGAGYGMGLLQNMGSAPTGMFAPGGPGSDSPFAAGGGGGGSMFGGLLQGALPGAPEMFGMSGTKGKEGKLPEQLQWHPDRGETEGERAVGTAPERPKPGEPRRDDTGPAPGPHRAHTSGYSDQPSGGGGGGVTLAGFHIPGVSDFLPRTLGAPVSSTPPPSVGAPSPVAEVGPAAMFSQAPMQAPPTGNVGGNTSNSLTIVNHNNGIMAPPQATQQIQSAAYQTSSPIVVGGAGVPL